MTRHSAPRPRRARWTLFVCILSTLIVWLGVLPRLGRQPSLRRHIERNRAGQIEPDAMFYTEVGPLEGISLEHRDGQIVVGRLPMAPGPAADAPGAPLPPNPPAERAR